MLLDLFTFQDETQLWISREFLEKYHEFPFYDIIKHSNKYEDGSYYIDIPSLSMNKVISLFNDKNKNISSLNLRETYDIYRTLIEYSVTLDKKTQKCLLLHIKELFIDYLKENDYEIFIGYEHNNLLDDISIELFNSKWKRIVTSDYKKGDQLLNPNSDEYIMEYVRLFYSNAYETKNPEEYEYYTKSEMNEYNKISSLNANTIYYSHDLIDSYNKRKEKNILPKLFKNAIIEAIYTNDYSEVENSEIIIKELADIIDVNLFNKIMTTHVFSNVTELIYDDESFSLSSIKKKCFPKLHIINYDTEITTSNFDYLFPMDLMSIIDTITILKIEDNHKEEITNLLDNILYTHLIHIDGVSTYMDVDASNSKKIKKLDCFENYKHIINCLDIIFKNNMEDNGRNSLEIFLKSSVLQHLNELNISFEENISLEYLTWISSFFNASRINFIGELTINLSCIQKDSSSEYLTVFENIMANIIPKASIVTIDDCSMTVINRLIRKGYFRNSTELYLSNDDITDEHFYKLYTTNNFPKLKSIKFKKYYTKDWHNVFIRNLCTYINHSNFPLSTSIQLRGGSSYEYIYDPNTSILRCKQDTHSLMDTIICTEDETMNKYEIEALCDYIYYENQLEKLINFITTGKIPKLKKIMIYIDYYIYKQINIYKKQLNDSLFIQKNQIKYEFRTIN
ncbi:hypothetical protein WA158_007744 [Blastocystis sp. Blastoise]